MFLTTQHKQRVLAGLSASAVVIDDEHASDGQRVPAQSGARSSPSFVAPAEVTDAALQQDLKALSDIKDVVQKAALKKSNLIPKWQPHVDAYLASGSKHKFEPLMRFVIWLLDVEQIDHAISYADYAIAQQLPMPKGFSRSLEEFTSETIHEWAQRQLKAGHSAEPFLGQVIERIESRKWLVDAPIILNKLYNVVGMFAEHNNELEKAERAYLECVRVNPTKHGVKTKLARVQEKLGKPLTLP